uniref:ARAD1C09152p n=1 Tax=Blastobotrys adeninivorans TaxID=409370 RepID=A0A060SZL8_BLAAD
MATRGTNMTSQSPILGNRYTGGATVPYLAGLPSPSNLTAYRTDIATVELDFPGYWGYDDSLYAYGYEAALNSTVYNVTCFCMRRQPCSCDRVYSRSYFANLPGKLAVVEKFQNYTSVSINGTLDPSLPQVKTANSGASLVEVGAGTFTIMAASVAAFLL